jgi:hypothetical protein
MHPLTSEIDQLLGKQLSATAKRLLTEARVLVDRNRPRAEWLLSEARAVLHDDRPNLNARRASIRKAEQVYQAHRDAQTAAAFRNGPYRYCGGWRLESGTLPAAAPRKRDRVEDEFRRSPHRHTVAGPVSSAPRA